MIRLHFRVVPEPLLPDHDATKGPFTLCVNVCIFVSGSFDPFKTMSEQHHKTVLNPFLDVQKMQMSTLSVNKP